MKIDSVGAELFHAGGRTDRQTEYIRKDRHDDSNSRCSQFCERAQNCYIILLLVVIIVILRI